MVIAALILTGTMLCVQPTTNPTSLPVNCIQVRRGKTTTPTPIGEYELNALWVDEKYGYVLPYLELDDKICAIHTWKTPFALGYSSDCCIGLKLTDFEPLLDVFYFTKLIVK